MTRAALGLMLVFFVAEMTHAGEFGRLFFTPEQRRQLEASTGRPTAILQQPAADRVLNGIVQRSDGTRTIWINSKAQVEDGNGQAPDVQMVMLPGKSQPVAIRVGQRLMLEQTDGK